MALIGGPSGTPQTNVKPVWLNLVGKDREETVRVVVNGKDLDTLRSLLGDSEDVEVVRIVRLKSMEEKTFSGTKIYGQV